MAIEGEADSPVSRNPPPPCWAWSQDPRIMTQAQGRCLAKWATQVPQPPPGPLSTQILLWFHKNWPTFFLKTVVLNILRISETLWNLLWKRLHNVTYTFEIPRYLEANLSIDSWWGSVSMMSSLTGSEVQSRWTPGQGEQDVFHRADLTPFGLRNGISCRSWQQPKSPHLVTYTSVSA